MAFAIQPYHVDLFSRNIASPAAEYQVRAYGDRRDAASVRSALHSMLMLRSIVSNPEANGATLEYTRKGRPFYRVYSRGERIASVVPHFAALDGSAICAELGRAKRALKWRFGLHDIAEDRWTHIGNVKVPKEGLAQAVDSVHYSLRKADGAPLRQNPGPLAKPDFVANVSSRFGAGQPDVVVTDLNPPEPLHARLVDGFVGFVKFPEFELAVPGGLSSVLGCELGGAWLHQTPLPWPFTASLIALDTAAAAHTAMRMRRGQMLRNLHESEDDFLDYMVGRASTH